MWTQGVIQVYTSKLYPVHGKDIRTIGISIKTVDIAILRINMRSILDFSILLETIVSWGYFKKISKSEHISLKAIFSWHSLLNSKEVCPSNFLVQNRLYFQNYTNYQCLYYKNAAILFFFFIYKLYAFSFLNRYLQKVFNHIEK